MHVCAKNQRKAVRMMLTFGKIHVHCRHCTVPDVIIREFKKPRRRRRGQRRLKHELYFSYEYRDTRKSFSLFPSVKTISKLNLEHSDKFEIEI